jgi:hypothetical protein
MGRLVVVDKPKGTKQRKEPAPAKPVSRAVVSSWFDDPIEKTAARFARPLDLTETSISTLASIRDTDVPAKAPNTVSNGREAAGAGKDAKPAGNVK